MWNQKYFVLDREECKKRFFLKERKKSRARQNVAPLMSNFPFNDVCQAEDVSGETLKRKRMSGCLGTTVSGVADSWFPLRS